MLRAVIECIINKHLQTVTKDFKLLLWPFISGHWTVATWSHMIWANCWCWLCVVGVHTDYRLPCSSLRCPANIIASLPLMVSLTSDQCARDLSGVNIDTASASGDGDTMKTVLIVMQIILCVHCYYIGEENNTPMISEVKENCLSRLDFEFFLDSRPWKFWLQ